MGFWWPARSIPPRTRLRALEAVLAAGLLAGVATAQTAPPDAEAARIDRLERLVATVVEENRRLAAQVQSLEQQLSTRQPAPPAPSLPAPEAVPATSSGSDSLAPVIDPGYRSTPPRGFPVPLGGSAPAPGRSQPRFRVDYDNGLSFLPEDADDTPFSLRIRSQNMFRYNGFDRDASFWIDAAGRRQPIDNSNFFGIPRGRLIFSGTALVPRLSYLLNIDYNSVTSNPIGFRAYELGYRFSRAFELYVGQTKVPGSREWIESAFAPLQGPDRSMATTFFRPSLSQGVWIQGQPLETVSYQSMLSNGFNTLNLIPDRLNNRFCWSGSATWEPWGAFGRGYSDLQNHQEAAIRLGSCYTFAAGRGSQADSDAVENSPVRFSDGTIITTPNALGQGLTVQTYDISLAAIDLAYKRRGLGLSTELYLQDILGLAGNQPLPIQSTRALGGFVQGGYFVLPQRAEVYARTSFVTGAFGSGAEWGAGFNWFFLKGRENLRYTFDLAWLESSPAGQSRTGYVAGQSGLLLRTQITVVY
jgi:hypothetical protein